MSPLHPATQLLLFSGLAIFWLIPLSSWGLMGGQRNRKANLWFMGTTAYAMAASAFVFSRFMPEGLGSLFAGVLSMAAVWFMVESIRQELHKSSPPLLLYLTALGLDLLLFAWARGSAEQADMARAIHLLSMALIEMRLVYLCHQVIKATGSRAMWVIIGVFVAFIAINLSRVTEYVWTHNYASLLETSANANVALVVNYLSVIFYSFGYWGFVIEKSQRAQARAQAQVLIEQERLRLIEEREKLNRKHAAERAAITESLIRTGKLAQSNALTSFMAHEINQPLAAMQLDLESAQFMMQEAGFDADMQQRLSARVLGEVRRVADIVRRLRAMFIGEDAQTQEVSLDDVVTTVTHMMTQKLDKGHIQVQLDLRADDRIVTVFGELEHVLINLFQHALDSLNDSPVSPKEIQVRTWRTEDQVWMRFAHNRIAGAEGHNRPFDINATATGSGLGLGLWLARHIVERLGGRIRAEEGLQDETAFIVALPLQAPQLEGALPHSPEPN